jgi:hypothetical protein
MAGTEYPHAVGEVLLEQRNRLREPFRRQVGSGEVLPRAQGFRVVGAKRGFSSTAVLMP